MDNTGESIRMLNSVGAIIIIKCLSFWLRKSSSRHNSKLLLCKAQLVILDQSMKFVSVIKFNIVESTIGSSWVTNNKSKVELKTEILFLVTRCRMTVVQRSALKVTVHKTRTSCKKKRDMADEMKQKSSN